MILQIVLLLALATTALGQTYVVSDSSNLRILDACGAVNASVFVAASNLQSQGSFVYYEAGTELYSLYPNGTSVEVCSGCLPPTSWVIEGTTVIGYGITGITTQTLGSSSSTNVYTPSGPNSVVGVAVAGSVVYWLEDIPGGTAEIWAAAYPGFTTPTRNAITLPFEYTNMVKAENVIYVYLDGQGVYFEPRDTPELTIRSLNAISYPTGITSAVLAPVGASWAVGGVGGVAEGFSSQCTKNITSDITAQGLAVFSPYGECATAPCWRAATTTTTTTSSAVRPSPWVVVPLCVMMVSVLFF